MSNHSGSTEATCDAVVCVACCYACLCLEFCKFLVGTSKLVEGEKNSKQKFTVRLRNHLDFRMRTVNTLVQKHPASKTIGMGSFPGGKNGRDVGLSNE